MANTVNFSTYGFLNDILALNEENWRRYFKPFVYDSVQSGLQVTASSGMKFNVTNGECRCGGVMGILDNSVALDVDAGTSEPRIDSIVVQYKYNDTSTLSVTVVKGTPSSSPVAPDITKTFNTLWQMELAQISIPANATAASQCGITDKRVIYTSIDSVIDPITTELDHAISGKFSTSTAYTIGDYVIYNGYLYRFTCDHPAGAWNTNHVTTVNIGGELKNLNTKVSELTFTQISQIVKAGYAEDYFEIGDQIITQWNNGSYSYELPWDVVAFENVTNEDNESVPGMIIQAHWTLPGVQFDASEAAYVSTATIEAGTYNIGIGANWGDHCHAGYKYEFTTTVDVPEGGQIVMTRSGNNQYTWGARDNAPSTWVVYTYGAIGDTTPLEGPLALTEFTNAQTPTSETLGILNTNIKYSENGINNLYRAGYGYNRWSKSAMRQWLNSDADAGAWWTPQNPFDRPPQQLATMRGFMAGLDSSFLDIIKPTVVTTALNTNSDADLGSTETTLDTFFCSSLEEEYCVPQLADVEGPYWPYWKERLGLSSPQPSGADYANANHIRYGIDNHSSARTTRLRSAYRSLAYSTWSVSTTGNVTSNYSTSAYGAAPACVIC